ACMTFRLCLHIINDSDHDDNRNDIKENHLVLQDPPCCSFISMGCNIEKILNDGNLFKDSHFRINDPFTYLINDNDGKCQYIVAVHNFSSVSLFYLLSV